MALDIKPAVKPEDLTKDDYKYGFHDEVKAVFKSERGLNEDVVANISRMKGEPEWMTKFRLKALRHYNARPMPQWGADLKDIEFDQMFYYLKPSEGQGQTWDDVPPDIKRTFDRLGIPEA